MVLQKRNGRTRAAVPNVRLCFAAQQAALLSRKGGRPHNFLIRGHIVDVIAEARPFR